MTTGGAKVSRRRSSRKVSKRKSSKRRVSSRVSKRKSSKRRSTRKKSAYIMFTMKHRKSVVEALKKKKNYGEGKGQQKLQQDAMKELARMWNAQKK
jgi:hypothetical protein